MDPGAAFPASVTGGPGAAGDSEATEAAGAAGADGGEDVSETAAGGVPGITVNGRSGTTAADVSETDVSGTDVSETEANGRSGVAAGVSETGANGRSGAGGLSWAPIRDAPVIGAAGAPGAATAWPRAGLRPCGERAPIPRRRGRV
nr:hypothetical protein GCM10020093_061110 [Planobispora longispora]